MEESFYQSRKLPKDKLIELSQRKNNPAILRFLVMFTLLIVTSIWTVNSWKNFNWNFIISQICFGILICSSFASLHETVHNTAFKSKKLNQIAAFFAGVVQLYPSTVFRELHFMHHRHTHVPGLDPEISIGTQPLPSVLSNLPQYLTWISGIPLIIFKIIMLVSGAIGMPESIRLKLFPFVHKKVRLKLAIESLSVLTIHLILLFTAIYINHNFWALFSGQIIGHCILASYLTPEHNGLPHNDDNILNKTRSFPSSKFVKLIMWNMPYHAEHHAYPAIPFHALPKLHEEIYDELMHKDENHLKFHMNVLTRKIKNI